MSREAKTLAPKQRALRVPLAGVHAHPDNPNVMTAARLEQLVARIAATGQYPPLIVRAHPELIGEFQLLDGHQRAAALRELEHAGVEVVI